MSRVAKAPVTVPAGVTVTLSGQDITVKGPVGELSHTVHGLVAVSQEENTITTNVAGRKQSCMGSSRYCSRTYQQHG